jgi:pimeloyl-ACP methyl ester carboxylesterase
MNTNTSLLLSLSLFAGLSSGTADAQPLAGHAQPTTGQAQPTTTDAQPTTADAQPTTGYAPVNGIKMYYEIHGGASTPLILIHGGGSTIESSWSRLLPLLSRHIRVIAVELQAHGRTSDRNGPESFQQDADDVAALLKHLGIAKANIAGFSNGGTTTLQLAIHYPELVNKIIVISGAYRRDGFMPGFFERMPHATLADMPAELKEDYLKVAPDKDHLQVMFEKDRNRMIGFTDWADDDIRAIKAPALIMNSDHDVITSEHALRISHTVPNAKLVILPGTHGSVLGETGTEEERKKYAAITALLIEDFLSPATTR